MTTTTVAPTTTTVTTTTIPPTVSEEDVVILEKIEDEELFEDVLQVLDEEVTTEEVIELVNNDEFENLDSGALEVISDALSEAPTEVKEEFEEQVNVFSGDFDNYVPSGSTIPVEDRRVVVAVSAVTLAAAAPVSVPQASSGGATGGVTGTRRKSGK